MATLFVHGVGNPYGDLFAERVREIVAPQLREALQRAGRPDEPHVRGLYWGHLSMARPATTPQIGDREALRLAVIDRLMTRLTEPDAALTLVALGLRPAQLSEAVTSYFAALPAAVAVDERLSDLGPELPAGIIERLRAQGPYLPPDGDPDLEDLRRMLEQVGSFAGPQLGRLGAQPGILVAVDAIRAGRMPLLDTLLGGWSEVQAYIGAQGPTIRRALANELELLHADYPTEPLRIVGHSLGGVIAYELLHRDKNCPPVDLLVTAGSQVSLMAEYGLLGGLSIPLQSPPGVGRWLNVYDPGDPLAFSIARVANVDGQRVIDRAFNSGTVWPRSHSAYWNGRGFYDLLAEYYD